MSNVTVKPIVWTTGTYGGPSAQTIVGVYYINEAWNGGWSAIRNRDALKDSDRRTNFATIEAAKAAAYADKSARILSEIEVSE